MKLDEGLLDEDRSTFSDICHQMDFIWLFARMLSSQSATSDNDQCLPGWTAFNVLANTKPECVKSVVGYMPVIQASPTELVTAKHFLDRTKFALTNMSQKHSVVVLDEPIYAKAQEILWKPDNKDEYSGIVSPNGSFSCHPCLPLNLWEKISRGWTG